MKHIDDVLFICVNYAMFNNGVYIIPKQDVADVRHLAMAVANLIVREDIVEETIGKNIDYKVLSIISSEYARQSKTNWTSDVKEVYSLLWSKTFEEWLDCELEKINKAIESNNNK